MRVEIGRLRGREAAVVVDGGEVGEGGRERAEGEVGGGADGANVG